jgi:uridine kinase
MTTDLGAAGTSPEPEAPPEARPEPRPGNGTVETFARLADRIRSAPPRLGPVRLVVIDGPSGAGKSRFAARLAGALGGAPVVHTDDLLDGWDDQLTFWDRLETQVLEPLRHGRSGRYQRYLWHRRRFGGVWITVEPAPVVLVEGVTAARSVIRPEASLSVFVTAPDGVRLRRATERHVESPGAEAPDRVAVRAYLERWRITEERHFAADSTAAHVDLVVDGAPQTEHDPDDWFVRLTGVGEQT